MKDIASMWLSKTQEHEQTRQAQNSGGLAVRREAGGGRPQMEAYMYENSTQLYRTGMYVLPKWSIWTVWSFVRGIFEPGRKDLQR